MRNFCIKKNVSAKFVKIELKLAISRPRRGQGFFGDRNFLELRPRGPLNRTSCSFEAVSGGRGKITLKKGSSSPASPKPLDLIAKTPPENPETKTDLNDRMDAEEKE